MNPESRIQYQVSSISELCGDPLGGESNFGSLLAGRQDFRHFIRRGGFSSLFTNLPAYKALYLRAYKAPDIYVPIRHLYTCREPSTNQPFLCKTNPILSAVGGLQMNANVFVTKDYENKWPWRVRKNKPNSNPIKANFAKAQMNVNLTLTKDYRKKDDFSVRINKPNLVRRRRIPK